MGDPRHQLSFVVGFRLGRVAFGFVGRAGALERDHLQQKMPRHVRRRNIEFRGEGIYRLPLLSREADADGGGAGRFFGWQTEWVLGAHESSPGWLYQP